MGRIHFLRETDDPGAQPSKRLVIEFWPNDVPARHVLYSEASGAEIEAALAAVLGRLITGGLRMPLDGGIRWVDVSAESF